MTAARGVTRPAANPVAVYIECASGHRQGGVSTDRPRTIPVAACGEGAASRRQGGMSAGTHVESVSPAVKKMADSDLNPSDLESERAWGKAGVHGTGRGHWEVRPAFGE